MKNDFKILKTFRKTCFLWNFGFLPYGCNALGRNRDTEPSFLFKSKISEKTCFSKFFQNFEVVFHHNQKCPKSSREACFLYILKQKWRRSGQRFPRNPGFPENTRFHRFLGTHVFHGPRYRTWHRYLTSWFRFLTNWWNHKNWGTCLAGSQNTDTYSMCMSRMRARFMELY